MNTAHEQQPEQQGDEPTEQQGGKKVPGKPFQAGDPRINRQGRPRKDAAEEIVEEPEPVGEIDLLAEMEAVLQHTAAQDRGQTQKGLRKWYESDVKGFMGQMAGLKKEQMRAGAAKTPPAAEGAPAAEDYAEYLAWKKQQEEERNIPLEELMHNLLGHVNVEVHIGRAIADRWFDLSMQQRLAILEMTGVPHTFEINPGTKGTPTLSVLTEYGTVEGARRQPDRKEREGD
jgi:hypothetical protein